MIEQAQAVFWSELRRLGLLIAEVAADLQDLTTRIAQLEQLTREHPDTSPED